MSIINSKSLSIGDYILFQYLETEYVTYLGTIESLATDRVVVSLCDGNQNPTKESLTINVDDVLCNLFKNPYPGNVYKTEILEKPHTLSFGGNKITIYFPRNVFKEDGENSNTKEQFVDTFVDTLQQIHNLRPKLKENVFEFYVKQGKYNKSGFNKKSKLELDGTFTLLVDFNKTEQQKLALSFALSQYLWETSLDTYEKSDLIKIFSEEYKISSLEEKEYEDLLINFLTKSKKEFKPTQEDSLLIKQVLKEVQKIKCLTSKEIRLLAKEEGSAYIRTEILPTALNVVKTKENVLIPPLKGINALKQFQMEMVSYIINNNCSNKYTRIIDSLLEKELTIK